VNDCYSNPDAVYNVNLNTLMFGTLPGPTDDVIDLFTPRNVGKRPKSETWLRAGGGRVTGYTTLVE